MTGDDPLSVDPPERVICDDCGYPMTRLRTDTKGYCALHRYECTRCCATGTVEHRTDTSPVGRPAGIDYHGATSPDAPGDTR